MNEYEVIATEEFEKDLNKCDNSIKIQIRKELEQLKTNPYVGKPLGSKFFREKKVSNYRFYYLIYENQVVVFIIALSTKKDQQDVINIIKKLMPYYLEIIREKYGT